MTRKPFSSPADMEKFIHHAWNVLFTMPVDNIAFSDLILKPFSENEIRVRFSTIEDLLSTMLEPVDSAFMTVYSQQIDEGTVEHILSVFDYIIQYILESAENPLNQYVRLLAVNSRFSKYCMILNQPKRNISLSLSETVDTRLMYKQTPQFKIAVCGLVVECLFFALVNCVKEPQHITFHRDELVDELDIIMLGCLLNPYASDCKRRYSRP